MLSGPEIARQVELGAITIDPFDPQNCGPNSYDLRLGSSLKVYKAQMEYLDALSDYDPHNPVVPNSLLVVGLQGYRSRNMVLDSRKENPTTDLEIPADGLDLVPGVLYLGATLERTGTDGFVPKIDGRSSIGRLGVFLHVTAGFGDCGFGVPVPSRWTLEVVCLTPIRIYPGDRVCQIYYELVQGEQKAYQGKYQGDQGPVASKKHLDG